MKKKINCALLVDDDLVNNYISEKFIKEMNIAVQVKVANNGEEALRYMEKCPSIGYPFPELILLDINMPIMDAYDFLNMYRKVYQDKGKIVILTTSSSAKDKNKLSEYEVDGYINKPLTTEKIADLMRAHFGW